MVHPTSASAAEATPPLVAELTAVPATQRRVTAWVYGGTATARRKAAAATAHGRPGRRRTTAAARPLTCGTSSPRSDSPRSRAPHSCRCALLPCCPHHRITGCLLASSSPPVCSNHDANALDSWPAGAYLTQSQLAPPRTPAKKLRSQALMRTDRRSGGAPATQSSASKPSGCGSSHICGAPPPANIRRIIAIYGILTSGRRTHGGRPHVDSFRPDCCDGGAMWDSVPAQRPPFRR